MKRRSGMVVLVMLIFVVISLITNILGPLIPEIISAYKLSLAAAGLLPFAFFAAYGLGSIPAGVWIEASSEKRVIVASFALSFGGALAFALWPRYGVAIGSLFAMGLAMAALQVAINPLLRVAGGEEHFAFHSALAQLVFGAASFVSPRVYSLLVEDAPARGLGGGIIARLRASAPPALPWVSLYWIFAALSLAMVAVVALCRLPRVERTDEERAGTLAAHRALLSGGVVPLYFVSVFMYVGSEQGVASWMSQFLATYHGLDPRTDGASAVSWFWGLMTIGCLVGLGVLKLVDSRKVLVVNSAAALLLLGAGLLGGTGVARIAWPALGLCASLMWPVIMSLALNSVASHHGTVSGILCTGIVGGAVVPLVIGQIGDRFGLRVGLGLLFATFGWILGVGLWARPLVANKTVT